MVAAKKDKGTVKLKCPLRQCLHHTSIPIDLKLTTVPVHKANLPHIKAKQIALHTDKLRFKVSYETCSWRIRRKETTSRGWIRADNLSAARPSSFE